MKNILLYCSGQFGVMLLTRFLFQWLFSFGAQEFRDGMVLLSGSILGVLFLIFRIFDAVSDPLIGYFTQLWVAKGRSKLQLIGCASFLPVIGLVICFLPSSNFSSSFNWLFICLGLLLFFIGYTLYAIPYWSLVSELAGSVEDRQTLFSNILGVGLLLATAIGFIVTPYLVESFGYRLAAIIVAFTAGLCMLLPLMLTVAESDSSQIKYDTAFFDSVIELTKDYKFLAILSLIGGAQMAFTTMTAVTPLLVTGLMFGSKADVALLLGPLLLAALGFLTVVPKLANKFGSYIICVIASIYLIVVCIAIYFWAFPATVSYSRGMVLFALAGPSLAVLLGLEAKLLVERASYNGKPSSLYFGFYNFTIKLLNGVALAVVGFIISSYTVDRDPEALLGSIIFAGVTCFLGVLGYFLFASKETTINTLNHNL